MQRIYVDFSRGESPDRVEVGFADIWQLQSVDLREGEHVIVHDSSLEVEGALHQEIRLGKRYWFAIPDWTTRQDTDDIPVFPQQQAG